ncbi:guanylate cyclase 32E [Lingula anatina]|uniref:Guanylate cyclase n=1 Tax=Lingula anatina TaxID=7574 RepID=A0A1S3HFS9_LINAN|nr:guanylate cyclase 32E [Lingula anatina]|eukprot:XP_013384336.1 guanylate cyclase 32E [Lingula anatina]
MTTPLKMLKLNGGLSFAILCIYCHLVQNLSAHVVPSNRSRGVKIGFLPAMTVGKGKQFAGAFLYGLEHINKEYNLSVDYMFEDNKVDTFESIKAMTNMYHEVSAFVGPEGTCRTEGVVAAAWNLPMIAFKCPDSGLSYKVHYPTFARTQPSTFKVSKSVIALMKYFQWTKTALIVGNRTIWLETAAAVKELADQNDISITVERIFEDKFTTAMNDIVDETHQHTRVYVILGNRFASINFARYLYDSGLQKNGEYVVISVQEQPFQPSNIKRYVAKFPYYKSDNDLTLERIDAFRAVLTLALRPPSNPNYEEFLDKTRNYSSEKPFNAPHKMIPGKKFPVPIYAAHLYDAVAIYGRALSEVLAMPNGKPDDGRAIFNQIRSRAFKSIQGHDVFIDENGDTEGNYTVLTVQRDPSFPRGWTIRSVGAFTSRDNKSAVLDFNMHGSIQWLKGKVPVCEPPCGFRNEKCQSDFDWTVASVGCVFAAVFVVIVSVLGLRHYLYEQKLAKLLWKIDFKGLQLPESDLKSPGLKCERRDSTDSMDLLIPSSTPLAPFTESLTPFRNNIQIGTYKGMVVAVKFINRKPVQVNREMKKELQHRKDINHDNINRFLGACLDGPRVCVVSQFCSRGSLHDILENNNMKLDDMFIASLVLDLIKGMIFIHESRIGSHGNLKSTNCLVDTRWVLQISDFGLYSLDSHTDRRQSVDGLNYYKDLLWTAPELLRSANRPPQGTPKGDVYSFAIILFEVHARNGPWGDAKMPPQDIIEHVKSTSNVTEPFRPETHLLSCKPHIVNCIKQCWTENPDDRPDFKSIRTMLKSMQQGLHSNIFDNMIAMMEKYSNHLEDLVDDRTMQLSEEKKKTELLLLRMLPRSVADQLKRGERVSPETYSSVTIYFSDIVGFTVLSAESSPMQIVDMLNDLYTLFDSITSHYDVYKVETIGDAYMVVSGLPLRNGDNHAGEIASMSLQLLSAIKTFKIRHKPNEMLKLRIGLHSGQCVAGVVGLKMPRYCLFGDTVNTASRMESTGVALKIHISMACKLILDKLGGYQLEERGNIHVKGKGEMTTYFLLSEDTAFRSRRLEQQTVISNGNPSSTCNLDTILGEKGLCRPVSRHSSMTNSNWSLYNNRAVQHHKGSSDWSSKMDSPIFFTSDLQHGRKLGVFPIGNEARGMKKGFQNSACGGNWESRV